jgi:hypothetical protein
MSGYDIVGQVRRACAASGCCMQVLRACAASGCGMRVLWREGTASGCCCERVRWRAGVAGEYGGDRAELWACSMARSATSFSRPRRASADAARGCGMRVRRACAASVCCGERVRRRAGAACGCGASECGGCVTHQAKHGILSGTSRYSFPSMLFSPS